MKTAEEIIEQYPDYAKSLANEVIYGKTIAVMEEFASQRDDEWTFPIQLCPKCNGQGIVSKPPYVPGDIHQWTSIETTFTCDVCDGAKTIPPPPSPKKQDDKERKGGKE